MKRLLSILLCGCFFSCVKVDTEANNLGNGYADSQIVGTWKITGIRSDYPFDWDNNGSKETDIYTTWSSCQRDNLYQFAPDKTGVYQFNCNNSKTGNWQLFNYTTLAITTDVQGQEAETISQMSANQFETIRKVVATDNKIYQVTKTWTRQ